MAKMAIRSAYSIEDGGRLTLMVEDSVVAMDVVTLLVVLVNVRIPQDTRERVYRQFREDTIECSTCTAGHGYGLPGRIGFCRSSHLKLTSQSMLLRFEVCLIPRERAVPRTH
jgi:hypothetical protein